MWKVVRTVCITYTRNNSLLVGKRIIVCFASVFFFFLFISFHFFYVFMFVCICLVKKRRRCVLG